MPYIKGVGQRQSIDLRMSGASSLIITEGDLNFAITRLLVHYIASRGGVRYSRINEVMGVLECAKQEFYRQVAAPYEDKKLAENGNVYNELFEGETCPQE